MTYHTTTPAELPAWAILEIARAEMTARLLVLAVDRPDDKPIPVAGAWARPFVDLLQRITRMCQARDLWPDFLQRMEVTIESIPGLLAEMDTKPLADAIQAGMATAVVEGASNALAKVGRGKSVPQTFAAGIDLGPLEEAVAKLGSRTPVAAKLTSAEWADVPLALRERAQFSANVESVRFLSEVQDKLRKRLTWTREQIAKSDTAAGGEALVDRSSFIADMRALAIDEGINTTDPAHYGTVRDIRSAKRLGLIWDMQTKQASEFARWKMDHDPDVLDAWPAQRLLRVEEREHKRDWQSRWQAAGDEASWMGASRTAMVALKTSPIWTALSVFGTPWPPFDWGSGMGLEDVDRNEAEDLGLIAPDAPVPDYRSGSSPAGFNDQLQASVTDLADWAIARLLSVFGDKISLKDGVAAWVG